MKEPGMVHTYAMSAVHLLHSVKTFPGSLKMLVNIHKRHNCSSLSIRPSACGLLSQILRA